MKKTFILISLILLCIVCKDKIDKPNKIHVGNWNIAGFDVLPLHIKLNRHIPDRLLARPGNAEVKDSIGYLQFIDSLLSKKDD